ncbi:eukaryotic translation initiation factor 6-2-like [Chenopodium quinoa]|uniref:Eukaryotic translation initiation factor 6 n=1 Tax=Chenopodium quinoa TaxID=63459 RepID=A0A803LBA8_CHEQI|nr:eukaryotic translation initiation factor 6-2-like [Chenopodium quinoa]
METLARRIPVVKTTIAGTNDIGRLCVGNSRALIVPMETTDEEYAHLQKRHPFNIPLLRLYKHVPDLGTRVACNDCVALIDPDLDEEIESIISIVLHVRVYRRTIAGLNNVGSLCVINDSGAVVHHEASNTEIDELSKLLRKPVEVGTVNKGNTEFIADGVATNCWAVFCGSETANYERALLESVFRPIKLELPPY